MNFNGDNLKLARFRREYTIKALAEATGLTTRSLSNYENKGGKQPTEATVSKLAKLLNYPVAFFYNEELEKVKTETVSFRALSKMTAAQTNAAVSASSLALLLNKELEAWFDLPESHIPDLQGMEPETAAEYVRNAWGIGELSIRNVVNRFERHGVRVFSLAENNQEVDAYSFWKDGVPFIFLNKQKSAERSRFDAAHELGHLVLHKHGACTGRQQELEADRFASALLMPSGSVLANAPNNPSLAVLIKLKHYWGVSLLALIRRLKDVGLLSEWNYRNLNIQASRLGYHKNEPEPMKHETSKLLQQAFDFLKKEGITKRKMAEKLSIPFDELNSLLFSLTITAIEGGVKTPKKASQPSSNKAELLRLVE